MTLVEVEKYFARRIVSFYKNELTYFRDAEEVDHDKVLDWVGHYLGLHQLPEIEDTQLPLFTSTDEDGA